MAQSVLAKEIKGVRTSPSLRQSLERMLELASARGAQMVTVEHLLLALTDDADTKSSLEACKVDVGKLQSDISAYLSRLPAPNTPGSTAMGYSDDLEIVLNSAAEAARDAGRNVINSYVVLATIVGLQRTEAAGFLRTQGFTFDAAIRNLSQKVAETTDVRAEPQPSAPASQAAPAEAAKVKSAPAPALAPTPVTPASTSAPAKAAAKPERRAEPPRFAVPAEKEPAPLAGPELALPRASAPTHAPATAAAADAISPVAEPVAGPARRTAAKPDERPAPAPTKAAAAGPKPPQSVDDIMASIRQISDAGRSPLAISLKPTANTVPDENAAPVQPEFNRDIVPPLPDLKPEQAPLRAEQRQPDRNRHQAPRLASSAQPNERARLAAQRDSAPPFDLGPPLPDERISASAGAARPARRMEPTFGANPQQQQRPSAPGLRPAPDRRPPGQQAAAAPIPHVVPRGVQPSGSVAPLSVDVAALAAGIPKTMRLGSAALIEVRLSRQELEQQLATAGRPGRPAFNPTQTLSARLRSAEGEAWVEPLSSDTLWLAAPVDPAAEDDGLLWRWAVTPRVRGPIELQLVMSYRAIGPDGMPAEMAYPEHISPVRVRGNIMRGLRRFATGTALIVIGIALGLFGAPAIAAIRTLLRI